MTGRKGEALDENEAVAALSDAYDDAHNSGYRKQSIAWCHAFRQSLNDADVVLVWDGPAEVASGRSAYQRAQAGFASLQQPQRTSIDVVADQYPYVMVGRLPDGGWYAVGSRYPDWDQGPGSVCDVGPTAEAAVASLAADPPKDGDR